MKNMSMTEKILWGLSILIFIVGIAGLLQRLQTGHTQAGYGTYVPWGLWVGVYVTLIGMSTGSFLLASVILGFNIKRLEPLARPALLMALATFIGGMLAVWLDLGHPLRAYRLYIATGLTSIMGWMAWFYLLYGVVQLALLWFVAWKGQSGTRLISALGLIGAFLALMFGGAEGALFGVVGARDFWHSGLTPIIFLVEGALSGAALVTFFVLLLGLIDDQTSRVMRSVVLGLLLAAALAQFAEISIGYYASIPAYVASLRLMLFGPYWYVFWIINIGLGLAIPLILLLFAGSRRPALLLATGLVTFTALSTKLNLVITAQAVPEFNELRGAYTGPGLNYNYFPTLMEWLLAVWIVGVVALVALAGYRLVIRRLAPTTVTQS